MHGSSIKGAFSENSRPAVVALGANLGNREETLNAALAELELRGNDVRERSSFYETKPVGYLDQPDFLNATALVYVSAEKSPEDFLAELLAIEKKFGRVRTFQNAPRTLDLDLIFFDNEKRSTQQLTLPHPRWQERPFVTEPLAEMFSKLGTRVPAAFKPLQRGLS